MASTTVKTSDNVMIVYRDTCAIPKQYHNIQEALYYQTHRGLDVLIDDGTLDNDFLSEGLVDFHVVVLGARLRNVA